KQSQNSGETLDSRGIAHGAPPPPLTPHPPPTPPDPHAAPPPTPPPPPPPPDGPGSATSTTPSPGSASSQRLRDRPPGPPSSAGRPAPKHPARKRVPRNPLGARSVTPQHLYGRQRPTEVTSPTQDPWKSANGGSRLKSPSYQSTDSTNLTASLEFYLTLKVTANTACGAGDGTYATCDSRGAGSPASFAQG